MTWSIMIVVLVLLAVLDLLGFVFWYACSVPRSQIFGPSLVRGPDVNRRIALTFDDGPAPPFTEQILDILLDRNVRATFFVCGANVARHPNVVRRIVAEGHTLGNHTYSHPYLFFLSAPRIAKEIDLTQDVTERISGIKAQFFRPPYGGRWFGLMRVLNKRGMKMVMWSQYAQEWRNDSASIVQETLNRLEPGSVVLLHDGQQAPGGYLERIVRKVGGATGLLRRAEPDPVREVNREFTVKALPEIIDGARRSGFEFVSVGEFFAGN